MHSSLIEYISRYSQIPLSSDDTKVIESIWIKKKFKKKQLFLKRGDVCQYTGFILKGAMRQYSVDNKGVEHTIQLTLENWWVVDRESYLMRTPSVYYIEAWEDTDLLTIKLADLNKFLAIPTIKEMFWQMDQNNHIASQKRLNDSISLSAQKRYENLIQSYPELVQRFPQHIIASYLGITKETLSRVGKQSMN